MSEKTLEGVSMDVPMKCRNKPCSSCGLEKSHDSDGGMNACVETLATEVQRLRDEREKNPGVWKNAPEWAISSYRVWNSDDGRKKCSETVTRQLPKTIEQEIAEKAANEQIEQCGIVGGAWGKTNLINNYLSAIEEFKERTK